MKIFHTICAAVMAATIASCDAHQDFPDTSMKIGDILCTDGKVVRYEEMKAQEKTPIAVVFYVNQNEKIQGTGYAVYLWDVVPQAFADSLGIEQGTSADIETYDGNSNTFAIYDTKVPASPMAESVFDIWWYGQSAFIPSVAEMRLLFSASQIINPLIEQCGGDQLSRSPDECWYWTSTEVDGQQKAKAWLYSMCSGAMQETPKIKAHKLRPIITIY